MTTANLLAAAVLAHLRVHGPATYRQLETALGLPLGDVVAAVRSLQEQRRVEPAGSQGWKPRQRDLTS